MNILEMAMAAKMAGRGSADTGGIQTKKIVFTDRPSLWVWMTENVRKVISAELFMQGMSAGRFTVAPKYQGGGMDEVDFSNIHAELVNGLVFLWPSVVSVDESTTWVSVYQRYQLDETLTKIADNPATELPDLYWSAMGVEATVYYYSE